MERISALMDGELDDHEVAGELKRLKDDSELLSAWETYHAIGDTLRGHGVVSARFAAAVTARLRAEPTVLAPRRLPRGGRFARVALPVAASICGVAVVGWLALYNDTFQFGGPTSLARAPQQQTIQVPTATGVNEYLLAHQQFSPRTDIQGVASYVRTVSAPVTENE